MRGPGGDGAPAGFGDMGASPGSVWPLISACRRIAVRRGGVVVVPCVMRRRCGRVREIGDLGAARVTAVAPVRGAREDGPEIALPVTPFRTTLREAPGASAETFHVAILGQAEPHGDGCLICRPIRLAFPVGGKPPPWQPCKPEPSACIGGVFGVHCERQPQHHFLLPKTTKYCMRLVSEGMSW